MIYNFSSSSVVQQSDRITHISLCCTVGPHCPSIPGITVRIPQNHQNALPSHSLSFSSWEPQVCSSSPWAVSVLFLLRWDHLFHILDSTNKWYRVVFDFSHSFAVFVYIHTYNTYIHGWRFFFGGVMGVGCWMQRLDVGSHFPNQGLNLGLSESTNS